MKLSLVIPSEKEAMSILETFDFKELCQIPFKLYSTELDNFSISLVITGCGKVNSSAGTQLIIDKFNPDFLIHTGSAGAINPELKILNIIWGEKIIEYDIIEMIDVEKKKITPLICKNNYFLKLSSYFSEKFKHKLGIILSADRDIISVEDRNKLFDLYAGDSCDWESSGFAKIARRNRIPFIIYRVISDNANSNTPSEFYRNLPEVSKVILNVFKEILDHIKIHNSFKNHKQVEI